MSLFRPSYTGFFGKLPARGDFLRAGLPEDFIAAWDSWCRNMLAASRETLGDAWEAAWMQAPIWRFLLAQGACGEQAVLGVWLPSIDKAGRHFPFIVCALAPAAVDLQAGAAWLDMAQAVALSGVVDDAPHENFSARLSAPVADAALPAPGSGWWTAGSPLVQPRHFETDALLPASFAGAMLRDALSSAPV